MLSDNPVVEVNKDIETIWKTATITDGFIFSKTPPSVTTVCFFPGIPVQQLEGLEFLIRKFVQTFALMPEDSIVSTYMIKQFKDYDIPFLNKSKYDTLNYLEQKRIDKINSFQSPEYHPFVSFTVPIKYKTTGSKGLIGSFKNLIEPDKQNILKDPNFIDRSKEAVEQIENTIAQINELFSGQCIRLESKALANFIGTILNHTTNNNLTDIGSLFTSDIFSNENKNATLYGGNFHATLSLRANGFPEQADHEKTAVYFSDQLKDIPFIVKSTLYMVDNEKAKTEAKWVIGKLDLYSSFAKWKASEFQIKKQILQDAIESTYFDNTRIVDFSYQILTWGETIHECDKNAKNIQNIFKSKQITLVNDRYNHKATYHSMLPFLGHINKIRTRLTSVNAEVFLPVVYPSYYVNDPNKPINNKTYMYTTHDVLMEFDIMDERDPSWNGIVVGTSGVGKSFFTNHLISSHMYNGGKVFIIDKGGPGQGSFRNFVQNIPGGRYVEMKWRGNVEFSINFFDGFLFVSDTDSKVLEPDINGVALVEKLTIIVRTIHMMTKNKADDYLDKHDEARLIEAIQQCYLGTNNNENNEVDLDYFAENYLMERFPDLYNRIAKFIGSGVYAKFFQKTADIGETDICCFDLEGLSDYPDLEPIMMLIITNYCNHMCMNYPGIRKAVFIDEAWASLNSPELKAPVESIWRTIRKHGGYIYCITQSMGDILKSAISDALMTNTTHFFLLGSNHDYRYLSEIKASGKRTNVITEYDYKQISEMKFSPPDFSEGFMITPLYKGVIRYRASKEDYWISTTNANDKSKIEVVKKELGESYLSPAVIQRLVK